MANPEFSPRSSEESSVEGALSAPPDATFNRRCLGYDDATIPEGMSDEQREQEKKDMAEYAFNHTNPAMGRMPRFTYNKKDHTIEVRYSYD